MSGPVKWYVFCHYPKANSLDDIIERIRDIDTIQWGIIGREIGPQCGREHMHGVIHLTRKMRVNQVKELFKSPDGEYLDDVQPSKFPKEAILYAKKDGNWDDWGEDPFVIKRRRQVEAVTDAAKQARQIGRRNQAAEDAEFVLDLIKDGKDDIIPAHFILRYGGTIDKLIAKWSPPPKELTWTPDVCPNKFIWGPAGTGKTFELAKMPNVFSAEMSGETMWFNNYNPKVHNVVLLDDFSKYQVKKTAILKQLAGHAAVTVQTKGGMMIIRPEAIYVTSNVQPAEIWQGEDLRAILRRFNVYKKISLEADYENDTYAKDYSNMGTISTKFADGTVFQKPIESSSSTVPEPQQEEDIQEDNREHVYETDEEDFAVEPIHGNQLQTLGEDIWEGSDIPILQTLLESDDESV